METRKIDLIWNLTLVCPWNCSNCCVDAVHVTSTNDLIRLRTDGLTKEEFIPKAPSTIFDAAATYRQSLGLELDLSSKLRVLDNLKGCNPRIDFSGGDVLTVSENMDVLESAAQRFGKDSLTLTSTGAGLARVDPTRLVGLISEFNFSYDSVDGDNPHRPPTYAQSNLAKAKSLASLGIATRAECPLSRFNCQPETLQKLYTLLHEANVSKLLPMRLFPVGRGKLKTADIPSVYEYKLAIETLRTLEARYGSPTVKPQCALRMLEDGPFVDNPCDMVRESLGLMADGTLLASPWAVGGKGRPLAEDFILGNLAQTPMLAILESARALEFVRRQNENLGHCKIFAFLNSKHSRAMDRMFDTSDPLYVEAEHEGAGA